MIWILLLLATPLSAAGLSDDVIPRKHIVDLTLDPSKSTFDGFVRIEIELRKPAAIVWINAKDISVKDAAIGGRPVRVEQQDGEYLGLRPRSPLPAGPATIAIHYRARADEKGLAGVYRRKVAGEWYLFTSFTPADARRAIPCFDEPRFKTSWSLTLHLKRELKAFANGGAIRETEEPDGMKAVQFAIGAPLAAEVVAFAAGPFDVLDAAPARVITQRGHAADGTVAAQMAAGLLAQLEAYTEISYQFGKLDYLALPDNTFSAVENPGLITFLASRILVPPAKVADVRAIETHELAHQWFGNLVTQATWDDVWLSEGFATWLAWKFTDERHLNAVADRERIMRFDASPKTRPVRLAMKDRKDLRGVYNRIIYDKGGSILMMLEAWLGEDRMRDGLRAYLKKFSFGNATTADLEASLRDATGIDPTPVLHSFLDQPGIPTVHADIRCDKNAAPRVEIASSGHWTIPVCWRGDGIAARCTVLDAPRKDVELRSCPAWIYLNAGGTGYYRTEWTAAQAAALDPVKLTPPELLTLQYDLRAAQ